jgi:manganese (mn2+), zinc (zn2+) ABC superfamily ATP binding cassette transporter membrane protein
LFYKELKISIFDKALASSLGMLPILVHYILMTLVSVTSVISFEAVGSILLISLMIGPAATAYMISKRLSHMLIISAIIGAISSIVGYHVAVFIDVSIAGSIAVIIGIVFIVVLLLKNMLRRLIG